MKNIISIKQCITLALALITIPVAIYPTTGLKQNNLKRIAVKRIDKKLELLEQQKEQLELQKQIELQKKERNVRASNRLKKDYQHPLIRKTHKQYNLVSSDDESECDNALSNSSNSTETSPIKPYEFSIENTDSVITNSCPEEDITIVSDRIGSSIVKLASVPAEHIMTKANSLPARIATIKNEINMAKGLLELQKMGIENINVKTYEQMKNEFYAEKNKKSAEIQEIMIDKIIAAQNIQDLATRIQAMEKATNEAEKALATMDTNILAHIKEQQASKDIKDIEADSATNGNNLTTLEQKLKNHSKLNDAQKLALAKEALKTAHYTTVTLCTIKATVIGLLLINAVVTFGLFCTGVGLSVEAAKTKAMICTIAAIIPLGLKMGNHYLGKIAPALEQMTFTDKKAKLEFDSYIKEIAEKNKQIRKSINDFASIDKRLNQLEAGTVKVVHNVGTYVKNILSTKKA